MTNPSESPLSAGAVPELPVVAKVSDLILLIRERVMVDFGAVNQEWLVLRSDAQATIHAQAAEIERLKRERDELNDARNAAIERSNFMLAATRDAQDVAFLANDRWAAIQRELEALKAKQVAEAEAVLQAGDPMSNVMFSLAQRPNERITSAECKTFKSLQVKWDAAREALRATLTKDRT